MPSDTALPIRRALAVLPPSEPMEVTRWAPHFAAQAARGSLVVYHEVTGQVLVHDLAEAAQPRSPASTFKIAHALLAHELGVVGPGEVFEWDGIRRGGAWDQDHTLPMAFTNSTVWVFQEVARRIGDRMEGRLNELDYGNADCGGAIDSFWLDGDLRITPLEQVDFLRRLAQEELAVSAEAREAVIEMMLVDVSQAHALRAKTGWASSPTGDTGWIVGWVEHAEGRSIFALAVEAAGPGFEIRKARREVLRAVMLQEGLLPASRKL